MKSLKYIKQRIAEGNTNLSKCNYESMTEFSPVDIFEKMYGTRSLENGIAIGSKDNKIADIYYDTNTEFNYFSMSRNCNDGTLIFDFEAMQDVLIKVLSCSTYNKAVLAEVPNDREYIDTHHYKYTIGNIVLCQEYGDEFGTKEKPWMKRRTTALLPIKFEVVENKEIEK